MKNHTVNCGLFVYGTLHPGRAPDEIKNTVMRLTELGPGTICGELHDLGEYPGLVLNGKCNPVAGTLFALPDDPEVLRELDAYEGYDPAHPETSLFTRLKCEVTLVDGRKECHWVYVYNRPVSS